MDSSTYLKWGINNILEIEKWDNNVMVLFVQTGLQCQDTKKNYSLIKRIGMNIADSMKIMSLAHIRIN